MPRFLITWLVLLMSPALPAQPISLPEEPWSLTRDIEIVSRSTQKDGMRDVLITADLYRPRIADRAPAAVIINSSGGITAHTELYYARVLARHGIAALVVDSFRPRGVRRTGDDQNRVAQSQSNADAVAGFRWLARQSWVDTSRIIVLGMSRGGEAAYSMALEALRRRYQATDIRFAAHVAIAPGSCSLQQRDARTTGAPIFFMLAELDNGTPALPCVEYMERMRAAGNASIRWAVYPGVYHSYEWTGGIRFAPDDWTARACAGRFWRDERGNLYERSSGQRVTEANLTDFLFRTCLQTGYTIGGDERVKAQATADLIQFLRDAEIITDVQARAIVPDCTTIPEGIHRANCVRARNGWTGDLVALARAFKHDPEIPRDDALAARLFELAASRNHPQAQWELSLILRNGSGIARDLPRALILARAAAEAGDPAGMNIYGVMVRDGIGRASDDKEAAIWFRRAADLRNSYGMTNLAQFMWDGRGGLPVDRLAAVILWRHAIYQDDNPWAQLMLAEALERGQGVAQSSADALDLYHAAAIQDREPVARQRAREALGRLGSR